MTPLTTTARRSIATNPVGRLGCLCAAFALLWSTGCASSSGGRLARSGRNKVPLNAEDALGQTPAGPNGIKGPTERRLEADRWNRERQLSNDPRLTAALADYDGAKKLYDTGHYKEAEKSFKQLASSRRATYESFMDRLRRFWGIKDEVDPEQLTKYGDPIEEDSMFMLAECQFKERRYSYAQDSYDALLEKYPSTRHMEDSTKRLLAIGMYWLGFSAESELNGDIKLAGGANVDPAEPPKAPPTPKIPIIPNVTDRTRPAFDTDGRALQALRSVWMHDAAGNLADDALMVSANYHLMTGDFVESSRLYKLLREQYPDSPHFQNAHLLGAHVTMASYEGPAYDGSPLDDATSLKKTALAAFPSMSEEERARLKREIAKMDDARVGRLWQNVEYYKKKQQPESIEIYCHRIINQFPDSHYAEDARKMLKSLERYKKPWARTPQPGAASVTEPAPKLKTPPPAGQVQLDESK